MCKTARGPRAAMVHTHGSLTWVPLGRLSHRDPEGPAHLGLQRGPKAFQEGPMGIAMVSVWSDLAAPWMPGELVK